MDRVCPLLGLQADRRTAIDGVDGGHRCYAEEPFLPLDRQQQARVCLTTAHERCDRYMAFVTRNGGRVPARSEIVQGLISTRMILAPDPAWRGIAGRARRAPTGWLLAVGAAALALGLGGVAVATGFPGEIFGGNQTPGLETASTDEPSPASVATAPSPSRTPSPTRSPTPRPAPTSAPTSVPAESPTEAPTIAPTVTPPEQQTYVVQQGDTLMAIAARFGTTASALQAANGIGDANAIAIGQTLVIP